MDGVPERESGVKPGLGQGPPAIDNADVADEIELGDREARKSEAKRRLEDGASDRVGNRQGTPAELGQNGG